MQGRNVCFLGAAGSAKSEAARIVADTLERIKDRPIVRCGTTALAGANIDGFTMHRTLGLGGDEVVYNMPLSQISASPRLWFHRNNPITHDDEEIPAGGVVLDEISMARRDVFDVIAQRMSNINDSLMFGRDPRVGRRYFTDEAKWHLLQYRCEDSLTTVDTMRGPYLPCPLIVFGDFKQLPPVIENRGKHNPEMQLREYYSMFGLDPDSNYAFMGRHWRDMDFVYIEVNEPVRAQDAKYAQIEMAMHEGDFSAGEELQAIMSKGLSDDAVRLYPDNTRVNWWNDLQVGRYAESGKTFSHHWKTRSIRPLLDGKPGDTGWKPKRPELVRVSIGTGVMITANGKPQDGLPPRYYNGSTGIVLDASWFQQMDAKCSECTNKHFGSAKVQLNNDDQRQVWVSTSEDEKQTVAMPLDDIWRWIKRNGFYPYVTGEYSKKDIKDMWQRGQLKGVSGSAYADLRYNFSKYTRVYDIVENGNYGDMPSPPSVISLITAACDFIPLTPMFAFTIHKAQGQTFDRMWVASGALSSAGATYTALTRCHEAKGLYIHTGNTPINWSSIKYDSAIDEFYRNEVSRNKGLLDLPWPTDWRQRIDESYLKDTKRLTFFECAINDDDEWDDGSMRS